MKQKEFGLINIVKKGVVSLLLLTLLMGRVVADESGTQELSQAQIAEMVNNPLSHLWMLAVQNDTFWFDGNIKGIDRVHANITTVMPIMPMQLTKDYKMIFRPWIPIVSLDLPRDRGDFHWIDGPDNSMMPIGISKTNWDSGIGDVGFWAAFTDNENAKPPFVWALGVTTMFDTASKEEFGSGKYSAGPMGLAFYIGQEWIVGGVLQHWWDYAGDSNRHHINKSNFQYVVQYRLTPETSVGMSPNFTYDWRTKKYDLPIGLGANTMINIGKLPVKVSAEAYYHINNGPDNLHNNWQLRLLFVPILPSPKWSKKPLF